jgi:hypothetical protein
VHWRCARGDARGGAGADARLADLRCASDPGGYRRDSEIACPEAPFSEVHIPRELEATISEVHILRDLCRSKHASADNKGIKCTAQCPDFVLVAGAV